MVAAAPQCGKSNILRSMPVIVIGADTTIGGRVMDALLHREGEVRAFVTDPDTGVALKARGVKVAVGDVSDASHVGSASIGVFTAVVVPEAAGDDRERAFAPDAAAVINGWMGALEEAAVRRVIWLDDAAPDGLPTVAPEVATVRVTGRDPGEVAAEVAGLDEAAHI